MGRGRLVVPVVAKIEGQIVGFCRKVQTARRACIFASTAGFTLLEAIIAAMVVGIAGVGVLMMFGTGQTFVQSSGTDRIAAQLALQRIEQVRATGFGTRLPPDPREELAWTPVPGNPGFERTTVVTSACSINFAVPNTDASCIQAEFAEVVARRVVVTVRALNNNTAATDPQTTPAVIQTVLVRR